jgi:hypothetical protein
MMGLLQKDATVPLLVKSETERMNDRKLLMALLTTGITGERMSGV